MSEKLTKEMTVGSIVAADFNRAEVLENMGIDYCCHGSDTLEEASKKANLNPDDVIARLDRDAAHGGSAPDFAAWPLDLLLDYVLKKHHRNFHLYHEDLLRLVQKVERVHGPHHPELHEVAKAVEQSFLDLDKHFAKVEQEVFPRLYELYRAHEEGRQVAKCDCLDASIKQLMLEHDDAGDAWQHITELTDHFTTPADGCMSFRLMNANLRQFFLDLKEHIALENNLIFPGFLEMDKQ
jgi:regulator of cell morphogenesis and NO signaling